MTRGGAAVAAALAVLAVTCLAQPADAAVTWSMAGAAEASAAEIFFSSGTEPDPSSVLVAAAAEAYDAYDDDDDDDDEDEEEAEPASNASDRRLLLAKRSSKFRQQLLAPRRLQTTLYCGDTAFTKPSNFFMSCLGSKKAIDLPCSFNMGNDQTGDTCVPAAGRAGVFVSRRAMWVLVVCFGWSRSTTQLTINSPARPRHGTPYPPLPPFRACRCFPHARLMATM